MRQRTLILSAVMLVPALVAAAENPAGRGRAAPWEACLKTLPAFDAPTIARLAGKREWKEYSGNPVVKLGDKGQWDAGAGVNDGAESRQCLPYVL